MATLTRQKTVVDESLSILSSTVPHPFPRSTVEQDRYFRDHNLSVLTCADNVALAERTAHEVAVSKEEEESAVAFQMHSPKETRPAEFVEIMPSIAYVQESCLMILNDLLSSPDSLQATTTVQTPSLESGSSASQPWPELYTLVTNLRERDPDHSMSEIPSSNDNSALLVELGKRVQQLANSSRLIPLDADLARALVSLLEHLNRLSALRQPSPRSSFAPPTPKSRNSIQEGSDIFDALKRSLSELQSERVSSASSPRPQARNFPVLEVESALLWSRIDANLELVLSICRQRSETLPPALPPGLEQLPPEYEWEEYGDYETPPQYDDPDFPTTYHDLKDSKSLPFQDDRPYMTSAASNEIMRLDLDAVTSAIDRLYLVAPQLHDQRVELKRSKVKELEKARLSGQTSSTKGKQKQNDLKDLDEMVEMIGRASARKLIDQSVVLDGSFEERLKKARQRDNEKRQAFLMQLAKHSDAGRLHDQEAVFKPPKTKDPEALLSLPEFIREPIPTNAIRLNPQTVLSLPEFINEPVPENLKPKVSLPAHTAPTKKSRGRSMSAPALSWIFNPVSKSPSPTAIERKFHRGKRPRTSGGATSTLSNDLGVHYIAEYHENLQHVMVFFNVTGSIAGLNIEAEISPWSENEERMVVSCGPVASLPAPLPARAVLGKREVKVQRGHFELKIPTISPTSSEGCEPAHTTVFDATSLKEYAPRSFICASCSLPLVQSTGVTEYTDLPSEHWEELVDAWMCHTDQKLHEHVVKNASQGFWPTGGQAFVGGSYIMFESGTVVEDNLRPVEKMRQEEWKSVRCVCWAIVGRCRKAPLESGKDSMAYRLSKYAIRPVSATAEPLRVPLSVFIVEDMQEHIHAHATYRFVLHDEEEDRPRILIWMFKPNMHIAYETSKSYTLPKSGCINAAKVLFKLLEPTVDFDSITSKYPGFPQAEHLSYPMNICHRLAVLLKESNKAYPESMRMLTGFEVGFLQRI